MKTRRVVITGLSAITPLGNDLGSSWDALLAGKSGIGRITQFDSTDFATHIAGEVRGFDPTSYIAPRQCQKMDRFSQFAVCAAGQMMQDAGYSVEE
ncbi:MAG: beta-ketoacyl-[Mailhella sp.]|nr:beta-ketoacyl-[acyl-carrier-protein] synthase II [Mailhella sp.]